MDLSPLWSLLIQHVLFFKSTQSAAAVAVLIALFDINSGSWHFGLVWETDVQVQLKVTAGFIDMDGSRGPLDCFYSLKAAKHNHVFFFFLVLMSSECR